MLISTKDGAWIETNPETINFRKAIHNLFLKINDYHNGELKNFEVVVYGSGSNSDKYQELMTIKDTNIVIIQPSKIMDYMKFKIVSEENKVINDIELYAQYKETEDQILKVSTHSSGDAITKIFKTGKTGRYIANVETLDIEGKDNVNFYVRALKNNDSSKSH